MSQTPLNIVNPKSLEKQLKIVETRIGALESEIVNLQKIKDACLVLLGTGPLPEPAEIEAAASTPAPKAKKKKSESDDSDQTSSTSSPEDEESEENAAVN